MRENNEEKNDNVWVCILFLIAVRKNMTIWKGKMYHNRIMQRLQLRLWKALYFLLGIIYIPDV